MSDRHKFRVWVNEDKEINGWPTLSKGYLKDQVSWFNLSPNDEEIQWSDDIDPLEPLIIGSDVIIEFCTGLRDINGVLIYEGDNIEFDHPNKRYIQKLTFKVVYKNCSFDIIDCQNTDQNFWLGSKSTRNLKIIGNIHENPELLGVV